MHDPQDDEPSALLRMAMRLYNSGYRAGHHDTVEDEYADISTEDMENYHDEEAREIVQDFLGDNLTDKDMRDFQTIFDDAPLPLANHHPIMPTLDKLISKARIADERRDSLFSDLGEALSAPLTLWLTRGNPDRDRRWRKPLSSSVEEWQEGLRYRTTQSVAIQSIDSTHVHLTIYVGGGHHDPIDLPIAFILDPLSHIEKMEAVENAERAAAKAKRAAAERDEYLRLRAVYGDKP